MFKLHYANGHNSTSDYESERVALKLKKMDVYTSNELVVLAGRALVKEGKIPPFIVVTKSGEYEVDENGRYINQYPHELCTFEDYLDRLFFND